MVSSGSSKAQSALSAGLLTAFLTLPPMVMTETPVASEPVPAVVGTKASGSRAPSALPTPQIASSSSPLPSR